MKLPKKRGITLIESLLSLSIIGTITTSFIIFKGEESDDVKYNLLAEDLSTIITAIDTRFSIDGYNINHWNKKEWKEEEVAEELLSKQLRSAYLDKCKGEWEPKLEEEHQTELIECDLWKYKIPMGLNTEAEITEDSMGFVDRFNLIVYFEEDEEFIDNFYLLNHSKRILKGKQYKETSGNYFFEFVLKNDPNTPLNVQTCIEEKSNCALKSSFSRSGLNETVRVDGQNSFYNDKISFVEDKLNEPLKCIRWKKTNSGTWIKTLMNEDDCGIGVYKESGYPTVVEVNADNGTYKNILINKECKVFEWNSATKEVEEVVGEFTACGMTENEDEIYQIVDNIHSDKGYFKNFYATDIEGEQSSSTNIITDRVSADFITVSNNMDVNQFAETQDLEVLNQTVLKSADIERLTVYGESTFEKKLTFEADLTIDNNIEVNNLMTATDVLTIKSTVDQDLTAINEIKTDEYLVLTKTETEGASCSPQGSLAKTSNGSALNCINGKWIKMGSNVIPMGTIAIWGGSSVPSGWLECDGKSIPSSYSSLKSFLGSSKTPDLRGVFLRGLDEGTGRDNLCYSGDNTLDYYCMLTLDSLGLSKTTRTLGTFQLDANKRHRHTETHFTGERSARGGSGLADNSLGTYYTSTEGAQEMVPRNISLKYIIKAN